MPASKIIHISEGMSFNYLIKGTLLAIFSGILSLFFLPALLGVAIGLALILSTSGVEIDTDKKEYRNYIGFVVFKMGKWKYFGDAVSVELTELVQQYRKRSFIMNLANGGVTIVHKTYDVSIENYLGTKIIVNDFDEYDEAVKCLNALELATGKKGVNHYAIKTASIIERRKQSRRR